VLHTVIMGLGRAFGAPLSEAEAEALPDSVKDWPAFSDTPASLAALQKRFRLAVLSNVDDDLFAASAPKLGVTLDALVTAQQCRSYKPLPHNFRVLLERTGAAPGELIHVAQSLYHDHAPAKALGLRTVWINRRAGRRGAGTTPPASAAPNLELPDLASLAAMVGV
jgi:2-haloacid dehalogenase